jgi:hypothetical protein
MGGRSSLGPIADTSLIPLEPSAQGAGVLPALLPERIVQLAEEATGGPAALYVVDIEGRALARAAGAAGLPARIEAGRGLGPELGDLAVDELREQLERVLPGAVAAPLWVRCRATAVLVATQDPTGAVEELARSVAPSFELASGYTDVVDRARRVRRASAAAEVQQDLLAPRIAPIAGGQVAGSLLPAYDVGGDWFDHAENPEGAWLTVADAMGKGPRAAAVSALALAALRGARRAGDSLEECCRAVHETVLALGAFEPTYLTAVVATWHAPSRTFAWVCCGHPRPLLVPASGAPEDLEGNAGIPLGIELGAMRAFERNQRHLEPGDRIVLYSDGITERRTPGGRLGVDGLVRAIGGAADDSAVATAMAVEHAVVGASDAPISDDATQLVLRVD